MSRVKPLRDDQLDGRATAAFASFEAEGRDPILLYRVLANAPGLIGSIHDIGAAIRYDSNIDRSIVELIVLRIAQLTASTYEWSHHFGMAQRAGVGAEQIEKLDAWREFEQIYSAAERAALGVVDEIHNRAVTDEAFHTLRQHFDAQQATEIVIVASHYESVARIVQALAVDLEAEYVLP